MVMDPNTIHALAEIRGRLSQLESALGARTPDEAEAIVGRLVGAVRQLRQDVNAGQAQLAQAQADISTAQDQIVQLRNRGSQLTSTVQAQQQAITSQQAAIDALTSTTQAQAAQISTLIAQVAALTPPAPPGP